MFVRAGAGGEWGLGSHRRRSGSRFRIPILGFGFWDWGFWYEFAIRSGIRLLSVWTSGIIHLSGRYAVVITGWGFGVMDVRGWVESSGLSQSEVARRLGMARSNLSRLCRVGKLTVGMRARFEEVLGPAPDAGSSLGECATCVGLAALGLDAGVLLAALRSRPGMLSLLLLGADKADAWWRSLSVVETGPVSGAGPQRVATGRRLVHSGEGLAEAQAQAAHSRDSVSLRRLRNFGMGADTDTDKEE